MWRFNPLLLRLLGEISLSLLCSHSSWGSVLDLAPPLCVGCLKASVLHPDRRGLKEQLIRGLWLTEAGGREGYRMRGESAAAEAGVTLQQSEVLRVFSRQSCPWITGPWQWRAAQAPGRGGVDCDLCSHTGFLVAAAAAPAFHACLWCPCPSLKLVQVALRISSPCAPQNNRLLTPRPSQTSLPGSLPVSHGARAPLRLRSCSQPQSCPP